MENKSLETSQEKKDHKLPRWVIISAFVVLLAFLGLLAWGLQVSQRGPIQVGDNVPDIELLSFDGELINTGEHSGKVILINFWASWCVTCKDEAVELEQAWQMYKPGGEVLFLGVDYVDTEPEALEYLNRYGVTYPNGPDLRTEISQLFRIRGVPETYILDRDGNLAYIQIGPFVSLQQIISIIDQVLADS